MQCYSSLGFKFKTRLQQMDVNQIFFLGHNKYGQAGIGEDQHNKKYSQPKQIVFKTFIKQVSCGNHHSALLTIDGLIYTMGSNIHGTLGLGNAGNINYAFKPTLVKDLKDVDQVFSGSYHMCAIKQGELYSWGKGIDGQLGHGNMKNVFIPTKVQALGNDVETVSCGLNHTLVTINKHKNIMNGYSFGRGIYGQLGSGLNRSSNFPVNIKLSNIEAVSAGENHSLFIVDRQVYGCGDNSCFQIGQLEGSLKNKKYILQPIRLNITDEQVTLIDCHNLSVALTSTGKSFLWGGNQKLWPPIQIDQRQVINVKVSNEKIYYINGENQLISLTYVGPNPINEKRELILSNKNIMDFDAGQYHLLALGDIVAQTQDKIETSFLSLWIGESFTSSKQTFSQKNINSKCQINSITHQHSINKQMPEFFFTMHLKSGMSQEQFKSKSSHDENQNQDKNSDPAQQSVKKSMKYQKSSQTFKTFQNMSSSIEIQSRNPFDINESETKNYFTNIKPIQCKIELKNNQIYPKPFIINDQTSELENVKCSENKLQKLMDNMEQKTIHLKRQNPYINIGKKSNKQIIKTPSSYIKKQPEMFVVESQQVTQHYGEIQDLKISQFDYSLQLGLALKQINHQNILINKNEQKRHCKQKNKSKSIIYRGEQQNLSEKQQYLKDYFKPEYQKQSKQDSSNIETIFKQLLRKQQKQKTSNQVENKITYNPKDIKQVSKRDKRLSFSCISSKLTEPSTTGAQDQKHESNLMPKLVPIDRSPNQSKRLTVSKISQHSNISAKKDGQRINDFKQISRSNRQLRCELRERDFKVSQLQEQLSKKEIQIQILFKQLQYFKSLSMVCQQCGNQTLVQDPFASV